MHYGLLDLGCSFRDLGRTALETVRIDEERMENGYNCSN